MTRPFTSELQSLARKYYRKFCVFVAHYLSYIGKPFEPYTTQNKILSVVSLTEDRETTIHLTDTQKFYCPIYKFTNYEGLYVAHVGHIGEELSCVKRFYSYFKCTSHLNDPIARTDANNTKDYCYRPMVSKVVAYKVELNYIDPLKEYLNVIIDEETGEIMEIFVEMADNELDLVDEPTFEDVITLWIAVLLWGVRMIVNRTLSCKKVDFRIAGKIHKLIQYNDDI